ncbi:Phosphatidylinositol-specific phospholipase-like protein, partial [Euroglyphus maynei]
WLSIEQKDDLHLFHNLSKILLTLNEPSDEYKEAVVKALDIPHSQVIPFFGAFLHDLKNVLKRVPSLIVLSNENANIYRDSIESSHQQPPPRIETISDFNGDNNYMSRIGVGGIINMEKMYKAHQVMDNLRTFHVHSIRRNQLLSTINRTSNISPDESAMLAAITNETQYDNINSQEEDLSSCQHIRSNATIEKNNSVDLIASKSLIRKENDDLYLIDIDSYNPIQPINRSHGISFIPFDHHMIDYHILQAMHHGTTIIHYEEDSGRSSMVYIKLEQSNSMIVWCKPFWSTSLRSSGNTPQDYQLSYDIENFILPGISMKYETKEPAIIGLEEGFLDLMYLKDVFIRTANVDLSMIGRRH